MFIKKEINFKNIGKSLKKIIFLFSSLTITGCYRITDGHHFNVESEIEARKTRSISSIIGAMGSPTIIEDLQKGNERYSVIIYGFEELRSFLFIKRNLISRKIAMFHFDKSGILGNAYIIDEKGGRRSKITKVNIIMKNPNKSWALPFYAIL